MLGAPTTQTGTQRQSQSSLQNRTEPSARTLPQLIPGPEKLAHKPGSPCASRLSALMLKLRLTNKNATRSELNPAQQPVQPDNGSSNQPYEIKLPLSRSDKCHLLLSTSACQGEIVSLAHIAHCSAEYPHATIQTCAPWKSPSSSSAVSPSKGIEHGRIPATPPSARVPHVRLLKPDRGEALRKLLHLAPQRTHLGRHLPAPRHHHMSSSCT